MNVSQIEQCRAFLSSLRDKGVVFADGWNDSSDPCPVPTGELILRFTSEMDSEDWLELSCYTTEMLLESAKQRDLSNDL